MMCLRLSGTARSIRGFALRNARLHMVLASFSSFSWQKTNSEHFARQRNHSHWALDVWALLRLRPACLRLVPRPLVSSQVSSRSLHTIVGHVTDNYSDFRLSSCASLSLSRTGLATRSDELVAETCWSEVEEFGFGGPTEPETRTATPCPPPLKWDGHGDSKVCCRSEDGPDNKVKFDVAMQQNQRSRGPVDGPRACECSSTQPLYLTTRAIFSDMLMYVRTSKVGHSGMQQPELGLGSYFRRLFPEHLTGVASLFALAAAIVCVFAASESVR